jgi:predicted KAP-like P-loop ATPase
MWHDVETTEDLLNFGAVASAAAQLIRDAGTEPMSIGISGGWGTGKSSLMRMVGAALKSKDSAGQFVFIEFNAWLYQGYDDARTALLQSVADKLLAEAEHRKTGVDKAIDFARRINWLRAASLAAPAVAGAVFGGPIGGALGALVGAVGEVCKKNGTPGPEDWAGVHEAYVALQPEIAGLLKRRLAVSLPREIAELRARFQELLEHMGITLVVLVDDLDRCLPDTALSTLEAMRLLLFLPRTVFVVAADEQMIRGAVRSRFGETGLADDLATSYFDKLIQIPLRVPRLGVTEVKGYLILLLAEHAERRGTITSSSLETAKTAIVSAVARAWAGGMTRETIEGAFGADASRLRMEIDLADQLAALVATDPRIAGNPRLIKRFLNDLTIREAVAQTQGMTIAFEELVKLQLFERCAAPAAFEFLARHVAEQDDGRAEFLAPIEQALAAGEKYDAPDPSWDSPFLAEWAKLKPRLADVDLRPLLHLSRDRAALLARFDELSEQGRHLLEAVVEANGLLAPLIEDLKALGETEAGQVLTRVWRRVRSSQWVRGAIVQALHMPKAFPSLGPTFAELLDELPPDRRPTPLIPLIRSEPWAQKTLEKWLADENSPQSVRKAIKQLGAKE